MTTRITLKAVAKHAGVSYQTVSKVLRQEGQLSPELRQRVQEAIMALGYRPDVAAQSLRTQASRLIGYSWCLDRKNHSSYIMDQFQHSIVDSAEDAGYHVLLVPQRTDRALDAHFQELVLGRRVDGFILSSIEFNDPRLDAVQRLNVPYASFGQPDSATPGPYVEVDGGAGIRQITEHLIAQGHTRIAVIAWPTHSRVGTERLNGYLQSMQSHALPIDAAWVVRGEGERQYGYNAAAQLLALPEAIRPTAIVTLLDTIAIGAMQAVEARGLIVGKEIAVTGFDDIPTAHHVTPRLTTIRQPIWAVGKAVISLLVGQLNGEPRSTQQIVLSPEVIIRESSLRDGQDSNIEDAHQQTETWHERSVLSSMTG